MAEQSQREAVAPFPKKLLILIALAQGLLLFWLRQAHLNDFWPATHSVQAHLLLSVVLVVPTLLLLALTYANRPRLLGASAGVMAVIALIAGYVAWQLVPAETIPDNSILFVYFATLVLILFKATMYLQVWAAGDEMSYRALFQFSWRNTLLMALCLLFTLIFWGILQLCALLFDVVGVAFFKELFQKEWFLFPVLSLAYGLAFSIFRNLVHILDTLARVLQALCQFLLPVLVVVALMFLVTLPFVGLSALWETGKGTALVLWLQVLVLFFVNSVYQDEQRESPYWLPLHRLIFVGVAILPLYSLVASYGLYLRVEQYGLTVERNWAILICVLVALFTFSYSWAIVRRRDQWVTSFRTTNVRIGLVFLALMVLVNTPLLDFRKLSLSSQLDRLASGQQTPEQLDVRYIARELGRPGHLALESLKEEQDEAFRDRVAAAYYRYDRADRRQSAAQVEAMIATYPAALAVPQPLKDKIVASLRGRMPLVRVSLFQQDLNGDGADEWIQVTDSGNWDQAQLWHLQDGEWQSKYMTISPQGVRGQFHADIKEGEVSVVPEKWRRLKIGDVELRVNDF